MGGVGDFLGGAANTVFGNSSEAGLLGTGQYKSNRYDVNGKAFTDQSDEQKKTAGQIDQQMGAVDSRQAAHADAASGQAAQLGQANTYGGANINQGDDQQMRGNQNQLIGQLQQQANGQGPSLASEQLKAATDRNVSNQFALASSTQGGGNPALAARNAQMGAAQLGAQSAQDSAQARIQEQTNARTQLAGVLQGARSQDQAMAVQQAGLSQQAGLANMGAQNQFALQQGAFGQQANMQNAGFQQQANLANQQAQMDLYGLNDRAKQGYLGMQQNSDQFNRQAGMNLEQLKSNNSLGYAEIDSGAYQAAAKNRAGMIAGLGQGMVSDEEAKTDVKPGEKGLKGLMKDWSDNLKKIQPANHNTDGFEGAGNVIGTGLGSLGKMFGVGSKNATSAATPAGTTAPTAVGEGSTAPTVAGPELADTAGAAGAGAGIAGGEAGLAAEAGELAMLSDEHAKNHIHPDDPELRKFYDALEAHSYRYKNPNEPGAAPGRFISPMAQELQKSEIGKSMVSKNPETGHLMVDYGRGLGAMLAGQAMFNERLNSIEDALKAKKTLSDERQKTGIDQIKPEFEKRMYQNYGEKFDGKNKISDAVGTQFDEDPEYYIDPQLDKLNSNLRAEKGQLPPAKDTIGKLKKSFVDMLTGKNETIPNTMNQGNPWRKKK